MLTFISAIAHWVYCLPLFYAVLLAVFCGVVFSVLWHLFGCRPLFRCLLILLILFWATAVIWITVGIRLPDAARQQAELMPFSSYLNVISGGSTELLRANFMNMLLFYPFGLLLPALMPHKRSSPPCLLLTALTAFIFSISIELLQYRLSVGLFETDDVIHNVLGAVSGSLLFQSAVSHGPPFLQALLRRNDT